MSVCLISVQSLNADVQEQLPATKTQGQEQMVMALLYCILYSSTLPL